MIPRLSLPAQLMFVLAFVFLFGGMLSVPVITKFYTFSCVFKEFLSAILPFIVFAFVATGILSFKKNAPLVLSILLGLIFFSNMMAALISYGILSSIFSFIKCDSSFDVVTITSSITPFFTIKIPVLLRSEYAMLLALVVGLSCSFISMPLVERALHALRSAIEWVLNYIFIPLLPLYVMGFVLKMNYEGIFGVLLQQYGSTVALIVAVQIICLLGLYLLAAGFSFSRAMDYIMVAFPSYITAFGTMSSTATVPVSIAAAIKNTGNRSLAQISMPIMANVHLLGDSIGTPILALMTLLIFTGCLPTFSIYIGFVFYFCLAMFAVSGIPGGGILVMIPLLVSQFGFTPQMVSIITALYLMLDSFGTAANVMGDGALVIVVNNLLKRMGIVE